MTKVINARAEFEFLPRSPAAEEARSTPGDFAPFSARYDTEIPDKKLTPEQASALWDQLGDPLVYLVRLRSRMEVVGLQNDELYALTCKAYDALHHLRVAVHYASCTSGVGKPSSDGGWRWTKMCGRYTLYANLNRILTDFGAESRPEYEFSPRYNIAPTQQVLAVRNGGVGKRELAELKWGLIPSWAKDEKIAYSTINARAETVADKPAFRSAFKRRRCLIVADGWYEWKVLGPKSKQPYRMHYADDRPFGMAGLWETWKHDGKTIESCTIIVTGAAPHLTSIHDRSPCIVQPSDYAVWLDPEFENRKELEAMLQPPSEAITEYAVSAAVGNVNNHGAELIEPV